MSCKIGNWRLGRLREVLWGLALLTSGKQAPAEVARSIESACSLTNARDGFRMTADYASACERACRVGNRVSCVVTGMAYEWGHGVNKDLARAETIYRRYCEQGVAAACCELGRLEIGRTHASEGERLRRAEEYLLMGCKLGDPAGCQGLVKSLQSRDDDASLLRAIKSYGQRCDRDEAAACAVLAEVYANGARILSSDSLTKAAYYEKACRLGMASVCEHPTWEPSTGFPFLPSLNMALRLGVGFGISRPHNNLPTAGFDFGTHFDILLDGRKRASGREKPIPWAFGFFGEITSIAFQSTEVGGGAKVLRCFLPDQVLCVGGATGVHYRSLRDFSEGMALSVQGIFGMRQFGSLYDLTSGLYVSARQGLGTVRATEFIVGVQMESAGLLLVALGIVSAKSLQ